ncbi:MAG: hypothetical protein PHH67_09895 [Methanosarcina sp.]|jgi:hypothetical protein|nr:hypothetical protein [Methanosarcina sp.]MDD4306795.1 hypothetical protein [Methanosarcina sp.]
MTWKKEFTVEGRTEAKTEARTEGKNFVKTGPNKFSNSGLKVSFVYSGFFLRSRLF